MADLQRVVEKALDLSAEPKRPRYSVNDIKAFQVGRPLHAAISDPLGPDRARQRRAV